MTTGDFEQLAQGATELRVELKRGDIIARAGEPWALEWSSEAGEAPEVEREGAVLRVRQRQRGNTYLPGNLDLRRLDVRLTVPEGVEVAELRSGLGRVDAEGMRGRLTITTGNGALSLRDAGGDAEITTGNGEVSIEGYEGKLTASTGNGRVRVESLKGRLSLYTGNGPVEVLDLDGRARASTGNGDLRFIGVAGEVELNTAHGQIEIAAPRSLAVQANTAMGGVRVEGGSLRSLRANSMVGELECSSRLEPGRYELSSGMGAITLHLSPDAPARVDAQTGFGQVDSDFPLVRVGRSGPMGFGGVRMVGSIGAGEPLADVSLRSGKGQIRLRRASTAGTTPPAPQPPAAPAAASRPDSALAVLEAVARGEVSPEEAERLLGAGANPA